MRWLTRRTVTLMTASFFALVLVQSEPSALFVAATVTLALGALFAARVIFAPRARELGVGSRARAHRELLRALPEPQHPGLLFLVQIAFNYFSYALMLFSIPLMLFSGCNLSTALRHAVRASLTNLGANLLVGVLFLGALMLAAFVVLLVAGLLGVIGNLIHAVVGSLLMMLAMVGFAAVVLVLLAGASYLAWRDTFSDAASPPPVTHVHGFEA